MLGKSPDCTFRFFIDSLPIALSAADIVFNALNNQLAERDFICAALLRVPALVLAFRAGDRKTGCFRTRRKICVEATDGLPVMQKLNLSGLTRFMRHSMRLSNLTSFCLNPSSTPAATRICHLTISMPVSSSVNAVLHLQACVHLHKIQPAVPARRNSSCPRLHI